MSAKTEAPIISRLEQEIEKRGISVPELEAQTGIPKDRVYKWFKRRPEKINYEDVLIIEKWISGNLDNIPRGTPENGLTNAGAYGSQSNAAKLSLEKSIENLTNNEVGTTEVIKNLTENQLRNTAIIERLVTLIEQQYGRVKGPELAPPGTPGTETMNPRKQRKSAQ